MYLKELEISGFKSFAKKSELKFNTPISAIVGPNGSGKSNIAESFRFVLGEQSFKSMRGKRGEDLIFNGTQTAPKQSKATVKLTFDNSQKILSVDFDEVTIERSVYRDGTNEYRINGSQVRLKDVVEILASANIGSSGHHIISQGEADRILNTNPKERKAMLEDALGLRVFQYKKTESERKLTKTEENINQVQSLRKEIAPHIKFLTKQVKKIEDGKKLKDDLLVFYKEYLKKESVYLEQAEKELSENVGGPKKRLGEIESEITKLEAETKTEDQSELTTEIKNLESESQKLNQEKSELIKEQGRVEGQIDSLKNLISRTVSDDSSISINKSELDNLKNQISEISSQSESVSDLGLLKSLVSRVVNLINDFLQSNSGENNENSEIESEINNHKNRLQEIESKLSNFVDQESKLRQNIEELRQKIEADKSSSLDAEKKIISLMSEKNQLQQQLSEHAVLINNLERDQQAFKQELTEAAVLVGRGVLEYEKLPNLEIGEREKQLEDRKKLERLKIKVEEVGGGTDEETIKEFEEVTERDQFLIREIEDLEKSAASLKTLIEELATEINQKFHDGVKKINTEFQNFFELMFGGGTAAIKVIKIENKRKDTDLSMDEESMEDVEELDSDKKVEEGLDISVNLPRKKIKGLMMLSGGERALTSIALLFAMSQVNPPPFIILDETDAALDEANSKKYADMVENLSKESQLILITHNRETMGRAGVLYGVTMVGGISQLLSVSFNEGTQWAK